MKSITKGASWCALCIIGITNSISAAQIVYNFENSLAATNSSPALVTASNITETSLTASYGSFNTTTTIRAILPSSIANSSNPLSTSADFMKFSLTNVSGGPLDFAGALLRFTLGSFVSTGSSGTMDMYVNVFTSTDNATWVSRGGSSNTTPAFSLPGNATGVSTFSTSSNAFDQTETNANLSLGGVGTLTTGQTLYVLLTIGDSSSSSTALNSALPVLNGVKGVYLDDLTVDNLVLNIPEPSRATLFLAALTVLLRRKRR